MSETEREGYKRVREKEGAYKRVREKSPCYSSARERVHKRECEYITE